MISIVTFIIGIALLVKGSDLFVSAVSRIAKRLGVSEFIIGVTLVAFATSIPEFANSIIASLSGYSDIIIGNIVGSNINNITLILGVSVLAGTIDIEDKILKKEGFLMVFVAFIFTLFASSGRINRFEAMFFLLLYFAYILFLLKSKRVFQDYNFTEFVQYFMKFEYITTLKELTHPEKKQAIDSHIRKKTLIRAMIKDAVFMIVSGAGIIIGANFVVDQAVQIAEKFGVPQMVIALTVVAVGTTLPELTVSIVAARKGYSNMAIGNLVGSNIANILLIIGTAALIRPVGVANAARFYTIPYLLFMSSLTLFLLSGNRRIPRYIGLILIGMYALFASGLVIFVL